MEPADPRRRHRPGRRHVVRQGANGSARVRIGSDEVELPKSGVRLDAEDVAGRSVQGRRPGRGRGPDAWQGGRAAGVALEQTADRRGRAAGDRQPHRADPRDGRRLQLRAQQVQPRDAGAAPGRIARSSRSSTRPRSIAASRPCRSSSTSRCRTSAGPNQPPYQPLNYDRKFEGPVTLRRALEDSRNIPAVKAMAEIGPAQRGEVRDALRAAGELPPYLSLALGAAEADARGDDQRLLRVPEPGRADGALLGRSASPIAKATCSRRTVPSRTKRSAPTPRSS